MDDKDGKQRVMVKYIHQNNPEVTIHPKNSNFKQAMAITNSVIKNLKKKNQLKIFKEDIGKNIQLGTLKKLSKEE